MISIIVALYNQELYIESCIKSILSQSYNNIEIIVVNDGSTDHSLQKIKELAKYDQRIKIINRENGGVSAARNTGIECASGNFIMFVDADDELEENAIEKLYYSIRKYNSDISVGGVSIVYNTHNELKDSDNWYYKIRYNGVLDITDEIIDDIHCSAWGKIFKKEIIKNNNIKFPEGLYYEDAYFHWAYLTSSNKISFIKDHTYKYYRRNNSIMSLTFEHKEGFAIHHLFICERIINFWQNNNMLINRYNTAIKILERYFWHSFRYSQKFEKPRCVYECARIARKFSLPIENKSIIGKICHGNIAFLFPENIDNEDDINYARLIQIKNFIDKLLPFGSNRRKILYYCARACYRLLK